MSQLSDAPLSARYAPGGDIYKSLAASYGADGANKIYSVWRSGGDVASAIGQLKHGKPLEESTTAILGRQLATDPFGAPLAAANSQLAKLGLNFLKNPLVALVVFGGLAIYFWPALRPIVGRFTK